MRGRVLLPVMVMLLGPGCGSSGLSEAAAAWCEEHEDKVFNRAVVQAASWDEGMRDGLTAALRESADEWTSSISCNPEEGDSRWYCRRQIEARVESDGVAWLKENHSEAYEQACRSAFEVGGGS